MRTLLFGVVVFVLVLAGCSDKLSNGTNPPIEGACPDVSGTLEYTSMQPPDLTRITVSDPDENGLVTVVGEAGAVPTEGDRTGYGGVALSALELGTEACAALDSDGSFRGRVFAPLGTTLFIAPSQSMEMSPPEANSEWGLCHQMSFGDGVFVSREMTPDGSWIAYGALPGGKALVEGDDGPYTTASNYWRAEGDGDSVQLTVRGLDENACLRPGLKIERLFDGNGRPRAVVDSSTQGRPITPTGFSVATNLENNVPTLIYLESDCLTGNANWDLEYDIPDWKTGLPDGWYRIRVVPGGWFEHGPGFRHEPPATLAWDTGLYGPPIKLGTPSQPVLPWVLFAETASAASGGSRGVIPAEMEDDYLLESRVALTTPTMILPRSDPRTGRAVPYRLEPWLPSISNAPFQNYFPASPLIPLDPETASLTVTVEGPDGTEVLGPASLRQSVVAHANTPGPDRYFHRPGGNHSFAGPNRTYGLTAGDQTFVQSFETDGRYVISIDGEIEDVWGNSYEGGGTYEVWIADALDLEMGTFAGTPMMVGGTFSPTIQVHPGVPADITITVRYYPNSDTAQERVSTISGTANRFGYFHPAADSSEISFGQPGEYRVDVVASYEQPDGRTWMASRTSASVVAPANSQITMHGAGIAAEQRWYFNNVINGCPTAPCEELPLNTFPMYRGDITWFSDPLSMQVPDLLISDPEGLIGERTFGDERIPLRSRGTGRDTAQFPEEMVTRQYWYESVQRPGESVQMRLSESAVHHAHWYTSDNYNEQLGIGPVGDLPNDIKLLFGGAVHRGSGGNVYGYYAAMDVIIAENTEMGQRTCPPFRGAAGGLPTCGSIMKLGNQDVDLFFTPTGVRPGTTLEVGDTFAFSGTMWPTLDTKYVVTVEQPDGSEVSWEGQASPVGYVSSTDQSFTTTQVGRYQVHVALTHDAVVPSTEAAPSTPIIADGETATAGYPEPLSAILGTQDSTFDVYVVDPASTVVSATAELDAGASSASSRLRIRADTSIADGTDVYYTLAIPGQVLEQDTTEVTDGVVDIEVDRAGLERTFPNFDPEYEVYTLSFLIDAEAGAVAQHVRFRGGDVYAVHSSGPVQLICARASADGGE